MVDVPVNEPTEDEEVTTNAPVDEAPTAPEVPAEDSADEAPADESTDTEAEDSEPADDSETEAPADEPEDGEESEDEEQPDGVSEGDDEPVPGAGADVVDTKAESDQVKASGDFNCPECVDKPGIDKNDDRKLCANCKGTGIVE